ncbi:ATP-grasp domain-containing protein [Paraburkholderia diazotrophica]|uniref:Predicted ATP-dependent carboligase, ATP-grasp superfamily n=1 Tax=Paraburkholderia diazotrophica TaxID=667676 RepID=A0A1H6YD29_9BURK|nr:ATP-grasp domain-containing protein [Paraburkholderia diazotrophica]SEJ39161.1 Predicted ATP-dependent carboligase, ATP-grasp superfamily [Paraburkholderia diazotrophica]
MKKILLYEYLSGNGFADRWVSAELRMQGRAMRDAVARDLVRSGHVALTCVAGHDEAHDATDTALAIEWCPAPFAIPPSRFLAAEARRHDAVWVIAPETDGVLSTLCEAVDPSRWIGCDAATLHIASSKRRTARYLARAGIATPRAWSVKAPLEVARNASAWVVKPDDGAGAVDTVFFHDYRMAEYVFLRRAAARERVTLEEWISGDALSLSLLCARGHAELLGINRQHIGVYDGQVAYEGLTANAVSLSSEKASTCRSLAARVARALPGLAGFVGVDLVWHPRRGPVVIEINPRATCAYPALAGVLDINIAASVVAEHFGLGDDFKRRRYAA